MLIQREVLRASCEARQRDGCRSSGLIFAAEVSIVDSLKYCMSIQYSIGVRMTTVAPAPHADAQSIAFSRLVITVHYSAILAEWINEPTVSRPSMSTWPSISLVSTAWPPPCAPCTNVACRQRSCNASSSTAARAGDLLRPRLNGLRMTSSTFRILAQQLDSPGLPGVVVVGGRALDRRARRRQRAIER